MDEPAVGEQLRVGCECGWEVIGTEDEIVPAVLEHGERVHNMPGTRAQVLANAQRIDASEGDHGRG